MGNVHGSSSGRGQTPSTSFSCCNTTQDRYCHSSCSSCTAYAHDRYCTGDANCEWTTTVCSTASVWPTTTCHVCPTTTTWCVCSAARRVPRSTAGIPTAAAWRVPRLTAAAAALFVVIEPYVMCYVLCV